MSDDEARRLQKEVDDIAHVPRRDEMRQLLERYFTGPIAETYVDLIESRFIEGRENRGSYASYASHLSSWTRWLGTAWYEDEDFTFDRKNGMTPRHLVVLIANKIADRDRSSPQPKLCHRQAVVGSWQQHEPVTDSTHVQWHFRADGTFHSTDPGHSEISHWCAQRGYPQYALRLLREPDRRSVVKHISTVRVDRDELMGSDDEAYRFCRITADPDC